MARRIQSKIFISPNLDTFLVRFTHFYKVTYKNPIFSGVIKNENGNNASNNTLNATLRAGGKPANPAAAGQAKSAVQARFEYAYGVFFQRYLLVLKHEINLSGYVPSFGLKNAQQQHQGNAENATGNMTSTSGRTNWAAKYSK